RTPAVLHGCWRPPPVCFRNQGAVRRSDNLPRDRPARPGQHFYLLDHAAAANPVQIHSCPAARALVAVAARDIDGGAVLAANVCLLRREPVERAVAGDAWSAAR